QTLNRLLPVLIGDRLRDKFAETEIDQTDELIQSILNSQNTSIKEIPLKNKDTESIYFLKNVNTLPQLLEYFDYVTELGSINDYAKFGNSLILFINKNNDGQAKNYEALIHSSLYMDLVDRVSYNTLVQNLVNGKLDKHLGNITIDSFIDESVLSTNESLRSEIKELRKTINRMKKDVSRIKRKYNRLKASFGSKFKTRVKAVLKK
ncbi:hypothetical protein ABWK22_21010, partial [Gottfriedia acidiceleris]|uniref:hypothetical protein n=1 Tax=Gottfriedia acidiceleris TaxID=371036 RepID=UPI003390C241